MAWVAIGREDALREAAVLDRQARDGSFSGALHGIPIGPQGRLLYRRNADDRLTHADGEVRPRIRFGHGGKLHAAHRAAVSMATTTAAFLTLSEAANRIRQGRPVRIAPALAERHKPPVRFVQR